MMANVVFVTHPERPEAVALAGRVGTWLREQGHEVRAGEGHAQAADARRRRRARRRPRRQLRR